MLNARLISGNTDKNIGQNDETDWLHQLSEAKSIVVGKNMFPLELAISLFNKDYADLRIFGRDMLVEILPAGLAALRSRGIPIDPERRDGLHFAL